MSRKAPKGHVDGAAVIRLDSHGIAENYRNSRAEQLPRAQVKSEFLNWQLQRVTNVTSVIRQSWHVRLGIEGSVREKKHNG